MGGGGVGGGGGGGRGEVSTEQDRKTIHEDSGAYRITVYTPIMKAYAVSHTQCSDWPPRVTQGSLIPSCTQTPRIEQWSMNWTALAGTPTFTACGCRHYRAVILAWPRQADGDLNREGFIIALSSFCIRPVKH